MKPFLLALQFLTAITLKSDLRADARDLARSAAFFPLVGLVIGIILAACWYFSLKLWPPIVADALVVLVLVAVTRAFHLDGLADTLDGVLGGSSRARALEIMKDTRLGAFGVMGIVLDLLLKFVALTSIPPYMKMQALVLFPVISRYSIVQLAWRTPSGPGQRRTGRSFPGIDTISLSGSGVPHRFYRLIRLIERQGADLPGGDRCGHAWLPSLVSDGNWAELPVTYSVL